MSWLEEEKELKQFLRAPQRVLCIMRERHYKRMEKNPALPIFLIAKGRVGHKHLVVISNRQTP
jgi:hypothetical protein